MIFFTCTINFYTEVSNLYAQETTPLIFTNEDSLIFRKDEHGNRIPDFSYCGYMAGQSNIPDVTVKAIVPVINGDATTTIQNAIDYVGSLHPDQHGFRGAVLLEPGTYYLSGRLKIRNSGIVLRGSGSGINGTTLVANGTSRETLIKIEGKNDLKQQPEITIQDSYIPVNGTKLTIGTHSLKAGEQIIVRRPCTENWVDTLQMHEFGGETDWLGWKPGRNNIYWDRKVLLSDSNNITIDIPITTALDEKYGGGTIIKYNWPGRITQIGIENLNLKSAYDTTHPKDEDHCWMAITIENATDCWVRQVTFENFAGSAVAVYETAKQVTVEDCISLHPVSEIGGQRRYTFFTSGQQVLFQRCYAEYGYHDFAVGNFAAGPNAFVQCESFLPYSFSGTIDRWASGVLFDIVRIDGHNLSLKNRLSDNQGAGWTAANCVVWQSSASKIEVFSPPTATNWVFGAWGRFAGNAYWYEANSFVKPRSLYYAQLSDRIGDIAYKRAFFHPGELGSTSSPSVEFAEELTKQAKTPHISLLTWIRQASDRNPISTEAKGAKVFEPTKVKAPISNTQLNHIKIENGWMLDNNEVVLGKKLGIQWWRGNTRPYQVGRSTPHITRFVPGRYGIGLTDNLIEVTEYMLKNNYAALDHHYGLWYDRRRDDHERVRRINGEVWPPFYELPFARSGEGIAWDGLSKYDLTKPNIWYWKRLKDFADLADQKGLLLIHQNYFQHNILEAGAHYTDFPWRTANNINQTGFPEPPPYAGDKRIFMAEQFYDLSDPGRKELHRNYIRQCLNNFDGNNNVIQLISEEYTGPLHFVEFWLDVIGEWEKETGRDVLVGLSTTKDVQDAILNDVERSKTVDIIDIKYWQIRKDGTVYAPEGGKNLAPRQHARLVKPGKPSFESVYKAVLEYKQAHPEKAVTYSNRLDPKLHWAVFMAGGSLAAIPQIEAVGFLANAATMNSVKTKAKGQYILSNSDKEQIIYTTSKEIRIDLKGGNGNFIPVWINTITGETIKTGAPIAGSEKHTLISPEAGEYVLWIKNE